MVPGGGNSARPELRRRRRRAATRDTTCYPGNDCSHLAGGAPTGYRWFYDLRTDTGTAFEVAVGHAFGDVRVEASAARRVANVEQVFTGTIYLDGTERVRAADSDYRSTSQSSVEDLTTHTLALNVYRDFPLPERAITPYVGVGLGLSAVRLSGEFYRSRYSCREGRQCDDPGQYDSYVDNPPSREMSCPGMCTPASATPSTTGSCST